MRIGLLGGTFNPPHVGHLVCAQEALSQLSLDVVRLVPVREPPHKAIVDDPGPKLRAELCRLAVGDHPGLEVSTVEVDRPGPSYTVDTLRALLHDTPSDELTFITGGDMARSLPAWREPAEILRLAELGVVEREGADRAGVLAGLASLGEAVESRVRFFEMPRIDVSSSLVRARAGAGAPIRFLVPDAVAHAIESRGLYRVGSGAWAR